MQMDWSYVGAVVITGLVIVFVALILLIAAVWLMGKIFSAINAGKNTKNTVSEASPKAEIKPAAPAEIKTAVSEAALVSEADDDTEIIAVIAAAVAAMSAECGKTLSIRSITPVSRKTRSNAWARAAAAESTRAF